MQYRSVNDAAKLHPGLAKGKTEIWYMTPASFRDFIMGPGWVEKQGMMPTTATLEKTHILLGSVKEKNLGQIFHWMQGEMWSPEGEARGLIKNKRLSHTSMSVGDIVKVGNTLHMVDDMGFKNISESIEEWSWLGEQAFDNYGWSWWSKPIGGHGIDHGIPKLYRGITGGGPPDTGGDDTGGYLTWHAGITLVPDDGDPYDDEPFRINLGARWYPFDDSIEEEEGFFVGVDLQGKSDISHWHPSLSVGYRLVFGGPDDGGGSGWIDIGPTWRLDDPHTGDDDYHVDKYVPLISANFGF